jgi:ribosomal protein S18 acetylase RimI-like enzyme
VDPSTERTREPPNGFIGRLREKTAAAGLSGAITAAMNRILMKGASLDLVHVLLLGADEVIAAPVDASFEMRFLTSDEVRGYATQPENALTPDLADRIDRGLDSCFAALTEGRLASYSWLALQSVEPEHAAGAALGLPPHMAYLYKAHTLPAFRGRRLYGAITAGALERLGPAGIRQILAFVYWNNAPALRACDRMGYRRLGLLAVRPHGPVRVPEAARRAGIRFGVDAMPFLQTRLGTGGRDDARSIA